MNDYNWVILVVCLIISFKLAPLTSLVILVPLLCFAALRCLYNVAVWFWYDDDQAKRRYF